MINVHDFLFNSYKERTYIVYDDRNNAMIIDPGCSNDDEENMLDDFIETNQLNVKFIVNTHCHVDHILGNYHIKNNLLLNRAQYNDSFKASYKLEEADNDCYVAIFNKLKNIR